jgi:hypothetical protein
MNPDVMVINIPYIGRQYSRRRLTAYCSATGIVSRRLSATWPPTTTPGGWRGPKSRPAVTTDTVCDLESRDGAAGARRLGRRGRFLGMRRAIDADRVTRSRQVYSRVKKNWGLNRVGNIRLWAARFTGGQSPVPGMKWQSECRSRARLDDRRRNHLERQGLRAMAPDRAHRLRNEKCHRGRDNLPSL